MNKTNNIPLSQIIAELKELERHRVEPFYIGDIDNKKMVIDIVKWEDVELIINKYEATPLSR